MTSSLTTAARRAQLLRSSSDETGKFDVSERCNLVEAARLGLFQRVVEILHSPKLHASQEEKEYALHSAAKNGHDNIVEILLRNEAHVDVVLNGFTPLLHAAGCGSRPCIRLLLHHSADLNECTPLGFTPLHQAAKNGHLKAIKLLILCGADPSARSKDGKTALDFSEGQVREYLMSLPPMFDTVVPEPVPIIRVDHTIAGSVHGEFARLADKPPINMNFGF
mmetsp:Transcript_35984/g.81927  ORF Transcript_35984/g.81927 Transcript_35984/m.81927 type:complete len:222 (-) Transcript_35984:76-741(-)